MPIVVDLQILHTDFSLDWIYKRNLSSFLQLIKSMLFQITYFGLAYGNSILQDCTLPNPILQFVYINPHFGKGVIRETVSLL